MHVRRALILFAVVLGLAALATAVTQPRRDGGGDTTAPEPPVSALVSPGPARSGPARIAFSERASARRRRLLAGRAATVTVQVSKPGQVEIQGLGLTATAEPLTPARFDVLVPDPGRHVVRFTPAGQTEARTIGVLRVVRPAT